MKIAVVYRYFWPDTPPYAVMLKDITRWLGESGHEVEMITAQPSYKPEAKIPRQPQTETMAGVKVQRLSLLGEKGRGIARLINSVLFVSMAFAKIAFGRRRDIVMTATMPPVLQALALCLAAKFRGSKFVYHMQDIYPEIAEVTGARLPAAISSSLKRLDNWTLRHADAVIVLSEDMASAIRARAGISPRIAVINNFTLATSEVSKPASRTDQVQFLFAGNMGRFQNLEKLVVAFARLRTEAIDLLMLGDGALKSSLEATASNMGASNIEFRGHVPPEQAFRAMQSADIGVVSLSPNLYRYAFPSKTLTYMAANLPMLLLIEPESALARMVEGAKLGRSLSWDSNEETLAVAIRAMAADVRLGKFSAQAPAELYHPDAARLKWLDLVDSLEQGKTA